MATTNLVAVIARACGVAGRVIVVGFDEESDSE